MPSPRASEVPPRPVGRGRRPTAAAPSGRQLLPSRSSRAAPEADLEIAQEPRLGRVEPVRSGRLAAALAAEPEPARQLGKTAARRCRRARRGGVGAPLRALEPGEQRAEAPLAPAERLL